MRDAVRGAQARVRGVRDLATGQTRRLGDLILGSRASPDGWGVNLVGYFHSALGLGEAARGMIDALDARGVPVVPVHIRSAPGQQRDPGFVTVPPAASPFAVNLFYLTGDGMRGFLRQEGPGFLAGRYSIGVWWWEVIPAPPRWAGASRSLDEIWVCSDHVRDAIAPVAEAPVIKVMQPVRYPAPTAQTREELGFPAAFTFYSVFDYSTGIHPSFRRKNPLGLVEAFRRAFPDQSGAQLLIRSINGQSDPHDRRLLERAAAGRGDIRIVDRYLSSGQKNAMLAHCDCYVSLHRAEGFGLPLAEAMRLGKPVIATGWSGNLEFMTEANSYLVKYEMSPVGPGSWPYPPDAKWAAPDLDDAARVIREVFDDPEAAAVRGRQAAHDLDRHDPDRAGEAIEARLSEIRDRVMSGTGPPVRSRLVSSVSAPLIRRRQTAVRDALLAAPTYAEQRMRSARHAHRDR